VTERKGYFDVHQDDWDGIYNAPRGSARARLNRRLRRAVWGRMAIALSEAGPIEGRTALDVGCGPGELAIRLAERGAARVVGIDSAAEMIRIAEARAASRGVAERCRFVHGDFLSDDLGDESFHFTIALGVLDYVADAPRFLGAMWHRSRDRLIASFPRDVPPRSWMRRLWHGAHGSHLHYYGLRRTSQLARALEAPASRIHSIPGSDATDVLVCQKALEPSGTSETVVRSWQPAQLTSLLERVW
jgi:SAM-dependent methyltransferase